MKPEVKEKWVNALRSGEYSQSGGYLRTASGYCCLGVLCDLYVKETNDSWEFDDETFVSEDDPNMDPWDYFYLEGESEFVPPLVRKWAELDAADPYIKVENEDGSVSNEQLVVLNDNGMSFSQLADLIEEQY